MVVVTRQQPAMIVLIIRVRLGGVSFVLGHRFAKYLPSSGAIRVGARELL